MSHTVIVTQPEFAKAESVFCANSGLRTVAVPDDEDSLAQKVQTERCRAVIVGVQRYSGPLYQALGESGGMDGAIISRFGVGHDSIDKRLAHQHRIVVTNTPGVLDASVAEHTLWLIGSLARHLAASHGAMMSRDWQPRTGVELRGQTLGILGLGAIGRRVAAIARLGFGMRVIAAGRTELQELAEREGESVDAVQRKLGLDQYTTDVPSLLQQADVLSIHLPALEATENFMNADRLAIMKRGSRLVNTARGAVLDEDALYDALSAQRLAGAALDVYKQEPYQPQSPDRDLRTLSNVVLTPHIGSNTIGANHAMAHAALENVARFLQRRFIDLTRVGGADICPPR